MTVESHPINHETMRQHGTEEWRETLNAHDTDLENVPLELLRQEVTSKVAEIHTLALRYLFQIRHGRFDSDAGNVADRHDTLRHWLANMNQAHVHISDPDGC
jgi:hypothetical protein